MALTLQLKRRKPRVEIVPMIDVMFFMLVFFLLFSTLKNAQTGVEVNLPKAMHLGEAKQNIVIITINQNAQIFFGKIPLELAEIQREVSNELHKDGQTQFIIKPDATVPYSVLISLMDKLAEAGVKATVMGG